MESHCRADSLHTTSSVCANRSTTYSGSWTVVVNRLRKSARREGRAASATKLFGRPERRHLGDCFVRSARKPSHGWGTRLCVPRHEKVMLRRPSAASLTVSVGALRTPWNVAESARTGVCGEPLVREQLSGMSLPSALTHLSAVTSPCPCTMGWPTVAVHCRYNRTQ